MHAFRVFAFIVTATLIGVAPSLAPAHAEESDLPERTPRHVLRAKAYVKRAAIEIDQAEKMATQEKKILTLDRALFFLRRARSFTDIGKHPELRTLDKEASVLLVAAAKRQAKLFVQRKSLPLARKRTKEALSVDSTDAEALALLKIIDAALEGSDRFGEMEGLGLSGRTAGTRYRSAVPLTGRAAGRRD